MKLHKSDFVGTGKVFAFSVQQYIKSKATFVLLGMMLLCSVGSILLMNLGMSRGENSGHDANTLYLLNASPYTIYTEEIANYVNTVSVEGTVEEWLEKLDQGQRFAVLVTVDAREGGSWGATAYLGKDSAVGSGEAEQLAKACASALEAARFRALGVTQTQLDQALSPFRVETVTQAELHKAEDDGQSQTRFAVGFVYAIVVFMLISFSTSFIVKAVAEEKNSKLVELLMVSVRPLALIAGKILAAMCLVLASIVLMILGLVVTRFVMTQVTGVDAASSTLSGLGAIQAGLDVGGILAIVISLVLGYLTFAILGGISGSSCSTVEESDSASGLVMVLATAGYLIGMATSFAGAGVFTTVISLLPILSAFIAPARYLAGQIELWVLLLSWLIQAVTVLGLARFCAGVYGALLIHRGERVKLKQIIMLSKGGIQA